eukprot:TRINITY_DN75950_c0_g1_i1.p1 TRINITY_DN75950_c0_g1~~TRINITY_DN75950_c0_g1_i1.p1  ORF type:complete len:340 (+),score=48.29 TRINITY_DN75950_c0_g1_i1:217-1236(+)
MPSDWIYLVIKVARLCKPVAAFVAAVAVGFLCSFWPSCEIQRCGEGRRLLHELLGICRDDAPEVLKAAYYNRLKEPIIAGHDVRVQQLVAARFLLSDEAARQRHLDEALAPLAVDSRHSPSPMSAVLPTFQHAVTGECDEDWAVKQIRVFDSITPRPFQRKLHRHLHNTSGWSFKGRSNVAKSHLDSGIPEPRFWYRPLLVPPDGENPGIQDDLTIQLWEDYVEPMLAKQQKQEGKRKLALLRAYANGQTFGGEGSPHQDQQPSPPHFTFIYYLDSLSSFEGGETLFLANRTGALLAVVPMQRSSAVLFPGCLLHAGRAPQASSIELRITVPFKLVEVD